MKIPTSNVTIWQNIKSLLRSTTIHSECDLLIWQSQKLKIRLLVNCPALSLLCPQTDVDVDDDDEEEYRTNYPRHVLLSQPIKAFLLLVPSGAQLIKSSLHSSAISSLQSGLNQCQLDCDWMEQPWHRESQAKHPERGSCFICHLENIDLWIIEEHSVECH